MVGLFRSDAWALTLRGISNTVRPTTPNRSAVNIGDLLALVKATAGIQHLLPVQVGILFGFFGFLRVSNLAPPKISDWDPSRHTTWSDVSASREGILLTIHWSKTRQHAQVPAAVPLVALGSSPICPLRAWLEYRQALSQYELPSSTPLLVSTVQPVGIPLTIPQFRAALHDLATVAGLSHCRYTPHSLRRGGATFSYQAGVHIEHIKTHSTWLSDAVNAYLQAQPGFATPVALNFGRLLSDQCSW